MTDAPDKKQARTREEYDFFSRYGKIRTRGCEVAVKIVVRVTKIPEGAWVSNEKDPYTTPTRPNFERRG